MAIWDRRPRRKTVPPADTRPEPNSAARAALAEATDRVDRALRESAHLQTPIQVPSRYDEVSAKAPIRKTLPTGDTAADTVLKSSYLTSNSEGRARKIALYQAWLGESFVSGSIEAIAARMVSGGWMLRPIDPLKPDEKAKAPLQELLDNCNPWEEFHQVIHSQVTDLGWAGECFLEVTWKYSPTMKRDVPYEIYTVDPISMDYVLANDNKTIVGYVQTTDNGSPIQLDLHDIIRVWLPDPRNKFRALSTLEKLLNPVTLDTYLQLSEQMYFKQGNRGDVAITLRNATEEQAGRFTKWIEERFLGVKNAHRPLVIYGEDEDIAVTTLGNRSDLDVLERRKFAGTEIMAGYKVPPHLMSQLEGTGQGGQAVGDVMEKQFVHTAVDPLRQRLMGNYSWSLGVVGFGITTWVIDTTYADMRDSDEVVGIAIKKIQAGLSTINAERAAMKQAAVPGGEVPYLVVGSQLIPVAHLPQLAKAPPPAVAAQQQSAQSGDLAQDKHELAQTQADRQHGLAQDQMAQQMRMHKLKTQADLQKASASIQVQRERAAAGTATQGNGAGGKVKESLDLREAHSYGCVMAPLAPTLSDEVLDLRHWIDDDDLAGDGYDDYPHVTVRYGLTDTGDGVRAVLATLCRAEPPIPITLGPCGVFAKDECDVLYLSVEAPALTRLHHLVGTLTPCAPNSYPTYTPHVTIAYLKPGTAAKYLSVCDISGASGLTDALVLSDTDDSLTTFSCTGHLTFP